MPGLMPNESFKNPTQRLFLNGSVGGRFVPAAHTRQITQKQQADDGPSPCKILSTNFPCPKCSLQRLWSFFFLKKRFTRLLPQSTSSAFKLAKVRMGLRQDAIAIHKSCESLKNSFFSRARTAGVLFQRDCPLSLEKTNLRQLCFFFLEE